jgi:hypothetical protein
MFVNLLIGCLFITTIAIGLVHLHRYWSRRPQLEAIERNERRLREREVGAIRVIIAAEASHSNHYNIFVENLGDCAYEDLTIQYEDILLWAERFSMDTTYMPIALQYVAGEPIFLPSLHPGQHIKITRAGYGPHDRYDGPRSTMASLTYRQGEETYGKEAGRWCTMLVDLPNARPGHV